MNFSRGRYSRPGHWLAACGLVAVSVAAPVMAQNTAGQVQLELSNTPLSSAIELLTQRSGAQIIVADPTSLADKRVTVTLNGMSVEQALNSILMASKIPWYKGDDGVYYINATPPPAPVAEPEPEIPAPARIITTEKIELRHQTPSMVIRALGLDAGFPLEPSVELKPKLFISAPVGLNMTPSASSAGPAPQTVDINGKQWEIWNGNAYLPAGSANQNTPIAPNSADRDIQELDSANQVGFPRGRGRGTTGATGGVPGMPGGVGVPGGVGAAPTGTTGTTQANQGSLVPDGITSIFPYAEDNSLLVRGEPDAIDELKNIIALLDVPVKQVSIKAEFVTVNQSDIDAFGLNWSSSVLNSNVSTDIGGRGTTATPTLILNVAQGNVQATLTALKQQSKARTILAPLISTLNNVPATITTSENYPIFTQQISQGNIGGGNIQSTGYTYITAETALAVIPRINRDGSVTVQIQPQVQQINGFVQGPNSTSAPIIVSQQLQTVRRVQNGESIVLGGLQTKTDSTTSRGIPFLQDLPLIGRLFRSHDRTVQDSQLLIFLTPTIVEETSGAQVSPQ